MKKYAHFHFETPVYASWKCPFCGTVNHATGAITYRKGKTVYALSRKNLDEACRKFEQQALVERVSHTCNILTDPGKKPELLRSDLRIPSTHCTHCGRKPQWAGDEKYFGWGFLGGIAALISGVNAFMEQISWAAWLIFAASLALVIYSVYTGFHFGWAVRKMPEEYLPVIGSDDKEVEEYALQRGRQLLTAEETFLCAKEGKDCVPAKTAPSDEKKAAYCRMCGTLRHSSSEACPVCSMKERR